MEYLREDLNRGYDEETVVNFFSNLYVTGRYSVGCFWCIFSCIRAYILVESKTDIKSFALLRKQLKSLTVKHLKKKSDIFTAVEMKKVLEEKYDDNNP